MNIPTIPHPSFSKIPRLNRDIVITEKIDGTNGLVHVTETGEVCAGSRNRWITPEKDNFGFAKWVDANAQELQKLGPGNHYGEWWGQGIQDGYGLKEKRFSLFNTGRWEPIINTTSGMTHVPEGGYVSSGVFHRKAAEDDHSITVACCHVVPILYDGVFSQAEIELTLRILCQHGSVAAPGYMKPEGIVVFHTTARQLFKITIEHDESPKSTITAPWRPGWGPEPK